MLTACKLLSPNLVNFYDSRATNNSLVFLTAIPYIYKRRQVINYYHHATDDENVCGQQRQHFLGKRRTLPCYRMLFLASAGVAMIVAWVLEIMRENSLITE